MPLGTPVTLAITGMSCGHCVAAISQALKRVPGLTVEHVDVGSATVVVDPAHTTAGTIVAAAIEAVRGAGYGAAVASVSHDTERHR